MYNNSSNFSKIKTENIEFEEIVSELVISKKIGSQNDVEISVLSEKSRLLGEDNSFGKNSPKFLKKESNSNFNKNLQKIDLISIDSPQKSPQFIQNNNITPKTLNIEFFCDNIKLVNIFLLMFSLQTLLRQ